VTPLEQARAAAAALEETTGVPRHDVAIVLGSGWKAAVDELGEAAAEITATDLPGFYPSTISGHAGLIRSIDRGGTGVLAFLGRVHLYEGRSVEAIAHHVRVAAAAGCKVVVLTNAAGGIRAGFRVGQPVLIRDHLNLAWRSPLAEPQFLDLTDLYSPRLRDLARSVDPTLAEGVYAMFPGPMFETPAEVQMARAMGADLVGMSTALEAIAARESGLEVLGISLVTNLAAGISAEPIDHVDVLAVGSRTAPELGRLLGGIVDAL